MYGQEELSKIEIDDTPAMMVERMAEIIAQKAENGAISVFVIDEVPMMTSRKNFADRKEELRYMIGLLGNCEKKEHVVIVAVIPVSKYCTEMQKKKDQKIVWFSYRQEPVHIWDTAGGKIAGRKRQQKDYQ